MPSRERPQGDDGTFQPDVPADDILAAVGDHEPASTTDVADAVGLARQSADYRLRRLADDGHVEKAKKGGVLLWSLSDAQQRQVARETADASEQDPAGGDRHDDSTPPETDGHTSVEDRIRSVVEGLEIQGQGPPERARRDALVAILQRLHDEGEASAAELKQIAADYPHGFGGGVESFWANCWRRDSVDELVDMGLIESGGGSGMYYWAGFEA